MSLHVAIGPEAFSPTKLKNNWLTRSCPSHRTFKGFGGTKKRVKDSQHRSSVPRLILKSHSILLP
jgi:hypothetical protein